VVRVCLPTVLFLKIRAFWGVAPCSLVGEDRRFRGEYILHHRGNPPDDGGSTYLSKVSLLLRQYIETYPKKLSSLNKLTYYYSFLTHECYDTKERFAFTSPIYVRSRGNFIIYLLLWTINVYDIRTIHYGSCVMMSSVIFGAFTWATYVVISFQSPTLIPVRCRTRVALKQEGLSTIETIENYIGGSKRLWMTVNQSTSRWPSLSFTVTNRHRRASIPPCQICSLFACVTWRRTSNWWLTKKKK
jgi:hypothetical protein